MTKSWLDDRFSKVLVMVEFYGDLCFSLLSTAAGNLEIDSE